MRERPGKTMSWRGMQRLPALVCLALCLFAFTASAAGQPESPHILVLNSYHPGYAWSDSIVDGIRAGFDKAGLNVSLHVEYLDSKRHAPERIAPPMKNLLRAKLEDHRFDLIITADNFALDFIRLVRQELLAEQPVVFCGINDFADRMIAGTENITGVVEEHDFSETIRLLRRLMPERKTYVAVSDSTDSGKANLEVFNRAVAELQEDITLIELAGLSVAELTEKLRRLPQDGVIFHLDFYRDRDGVFLAVEESFALIRKNSRLPICVNTDNKMGFGALGGVVTSGYLQGITAAGMAARILAGEAAGSIPVQRDSPKVIMFDYLVMAEFGLRPDMLPAGAEILNEPPNSYVRYKKEIWFLATVFVFLILIIVLLGRHIHQRRQWEREAGRWANIFENAQWGLALGDPRTEKLIAVNPAFARMHGWSKEELVGMPVRDVYAPEVRTSLAAHIQEASASGHHRFESVHLRKDGSIFPASADVAVIKDDQGRPLYRIVNVEDISARKVTENQLQETMNRLAALNSLASKVVVSLSLEEVAKAALHELVAVTSTDFAILYVLQNGDLVPVDAYSRPPFARKADSEPHEVGLCLCGLAAEGKPVYSNNIHADVRCSLMECKAAGLRSFAALPLLEGARVVGVLGLASLKERLFSDEADFFETLAGQTAMGIRNALLYDQLRQHTEQQEELVRKRTKDLEERNSQLERLNRLFVDREFRIKELRDEVARLRGGKVTK